MQALTGKTEASSNYRYEPLAADHIRVLEILPGERQDPINISLRQSRIETDAELATPSIPYYEALSYAWGSRDNPVSIVVGQSSLQITRSLKTALDHLRYRDRSRYMWIDAISIDQSNDVEKGPQVAMMGDIYQRAAKVVVWLGPEKDCSDHAFEVMRSIGEQIDLDIETFTLQPSLSRPDVDPKTADDTVPLHLQEDDQRSLYALFCRPWFDRLWIRQEISLANPATAIVACGDQIILWSVFRSA